MFYLDLTLSSPEQNLACDEALLDACEAGELSDLIRFWEPDQYAVVLGYGNQVAREVHVEFCRRVKLPILRRCTGGGTVLQGPGCLNYSLVLGVEGPHPVHSISAANDFIMGRHRDMFAELLRARVERAGQTDLAIAGRKFCGNAQRRRHRYLLFHGCVLLSLDFDVVQEALPFPSRQPDYRANRLHTDFLMNISTPASLLKAEFRRAWAADAPVPHVPTARIDHLALTRYSTNEWNLRF